MGCNTLALLVFTLLLLRVIIYQNKYKGREKLPSLTDCIDMTRLSTDLENEAALLWECCVADQSNVMGANIQSTSLN